MLSDARFAELCSVLGITKQCCFAPEQKVIEKAFRKNALKCHPDKGGDPVIFKKLNDAYNKLIGHCRKVLLLSEFVKHSWGRVHFSVDYYFSLPVWKKENFEYFVTIY